MPDGTHWHLDTPQNIYQRCADYICSISCWWWTSNMLSWPQSNCTPHSINPSMRDALLCYMSSSHEEYGLLNFQEIDRCLPPPRNHSASNRQGLAPARLMGQVKDYLNTSSGKQQCPFWGEEDYCWRKPRMTCTWKEASWNILLRSFTHSTHNISQPILTYSYWCIS